MPSASLPALEQRLEACLLELDRLHRERPQLPTALTRAKAGQRIDALLDKIAELQRMIDTTLAETLQDTAVKLRRLSAYVEQGQPARLLAGAVGAVERAAR
jgi:exonuclease VII large subunit